MATAAFCGSADEGIGEVVSIGPMVSSGWVISLAIASWAWTSSGKVAKGTSNRPTSNRRYIFFIFYSFLSNGLSDYQQFNYQKPPYLCRRLLNYIFQNITINFKFI